MEKILKTLETIKVPTLSGSDANIPGTIISAVVAASDSVKTKKKERISHCRSVTDAICLASVQGLPDYGKILESVVEVLFQLSSDPDSDIRLVASECLNRLVRTLKDSQQPKLHMEIYKEIRRNQNARSLRTALGVFAHISSQIKPQKCRAFFASLLPCFVQISKRTEEYLYENLASYFSDIFRSLGPFAQDTEIKHLCKEYITNLESSSAIIRRSSASILVSICQNSKKPHIFLPKLLYQVTGLLKPKLMEKSVSAIIGAMQCIRHAISPLYNLVSTHNSFSTSELSTVVLQLVQVYEMCVILCNHDDHNVVTTSLETLQQLLTDPIEELKTCLTSSNGIENSIDNNTASSANPISSQSGSLDSDVESIAFPDESPELLETDNDIPRFRSFLSSTNSESRDVESDIVILSRRNSDTVAVEENQADMDSSSEILHHSDEDVGPKVKDVILPNFPEVQIGSLYENNPPVYYCARFLAYNFLLAGQKGYQRPDGEVRISVKVLAINCLVNLVKISLDIYFLPLSHDLVETEDQLAQRIEDVSSYHSHNDPLLRGCTYVLMGCVIDGLTVPGRRTDLPSDISVLTSILKNGLLESSNIGVKCALAAVNSCLGKLWKSKHVEFAEDLFSTSLLVASNPYWLVKVDLIELLSSIEWNVALNSEVRKKQVLNILLEYLYDEDMRVRTAAVNCIPKYIDGTSITDSWSPERYGVLCTQCIVNNINVTIETQLSMKSQCQICHKPEPTTSSTLESVLEKLIRASVSSDNKHLFAGYQAAIAHLSETHSPKTFRTAWHLTSRTSDSGMLLGLYMDLLRSSSFVHDMVVHQSVLKIICNIFLASDFLDRSVGKGKTFEEGNPFWSTNTKICVFGTCFIQHIIAILKLYQNIIEQCGSSSASKKVSTSPVISPVKKFSQKLDAEKKATESEIDKKAKGPYFSSVLCQLHMRKINDSITQAWRVFRCSLDKSATMKFTALLATCLETLSKMFTVIRSDYPGMSSLIDDILTVTQSVFGFCPSDALRCIRKVLQSIFSSYNTDTSLEIMPLSEYGCRNRFSLLMFPNQIFRFPSEEKLSIARSSAEVSALGGFIRQFEPAVVSGLRIYTTTSDTMVQVEVLRLLKQLISGHVNYGLVDSNQVFLGFVIKQITFLEDGQIPNASILVEEMFQFLTLLSHEHHATKSFIDVPKVLDLCDILISSEYGSKSGVKALLPTVVDIAVKRFKREHTNWEKKETSSRGDRLLELLTKSMRYPDDVLPVLWILLSARQQRQESKWNDDSVTVLQQAILDAIKNNTLKITNGASYNCLIATLCATHNDSLPPLENLMVSLQNLLDEEIHLVSHYFSWASAVSTYWILIAKSSYNDKNENPLEGLTGSFILKLLTSMVTNFVNVYSGATRKSSELFVQQFGAVVYSLMFLLQCDFHEDLRADLYSKIVKPDWQRLEELIGKLTEYEVILRFCCIDLLSALNYPRSDILESYLQLRANSCPEFIVSAIATITNDLNDGDVPSVEEWVIFSHPKEILKMISKPTMKTFLSRLSKYRRGQLLDKISEIVSSNSLDEEIEGSVLTYLKLVCDEFVSETAIVGVELLKRLKSPYLELDVSQFICHTLHQIHTRQLMLTHKDRDVVKSFIENTSVNIRFPRLSMLAGAVLGDPNSEHTMLSKDVSTMVSQWCCEEITAIEGLALAKMLSNLKYTQIMNVFSQRNFNFRVLQYCFVHLRSLHLLDIVSGTDVINLFTAEQRSSLMEKWPLGVACVEFVVETLDSWENIVSDELITDLEWEEKLDWEFLSKLPLMWECLAAMLRLKEAVISNTVPEDKGCYNNFIPTKIFTISFQYILVATDKHKSNNDIPVQLLRTFLKFASAAFSDSSFVTFFNVRDSPHHIFVCARSLQLLVKQLVSLFRIDWNYNSDNSDYYSEIDAECARVLIDFDYLMDFVFQVRCGRVKLDSGIFELLRNVISGLGRCELINGWVLISHLRWKPQASWKSQIFPPIEPIPLEILRSDHDLLLQYIFKLNVFGVASKIQFEENWVIFLSVINLYVDESFQLQIVSAGLKALSMLLQQCVSIDYTDKPYNEDLNRLVTKIDEIMDDIEPSLCKQITFPPLLSTATKNVNNQHSIDVNSCIRFLTDLYTQWLQNPQGKMPLLLLSEVVGSIVVLSEYFEEVSQFQWMFDTLMEIYKSFEKEDELLWPHLMYGIFYSAAKIELETEQVATLAQMLESSVVSCYANVAVTVLKCGLIYLQSHPESLTILAVLVPYLLKFTQLDETSKDAESHSFEVWKLLLFVWVHGPQEGFGVNDFEQETLRNILTALSPINKAYVSVRLLVLKALRKKVLSTELKSDVRKKITKVSYETLSTPNISIFIEALKLYTTIFYVDFYQFRSLPDPDPEVLMPMAERTQILFQLLKSGNKCNNQCVSKVLSLFILDFLPPSEILNRVIAEFMSPTQTAPELLAPVLAQVFEKARRKPKEAALVREWILAGLPNFMNSADSARTMWSLTIFFIGVSSAPQFFTLLPFACLRRRTPQIRQLFIHSALDLYGTLDEIRSKDFRNTLLRNVDAGRESCPFSYLAKLLNKVDDQKLTWEIDSSTTPSP